MVDIYHKYNNQTLRHHITMQILIPQIVLEQSEVKTKKIHNSKMQSLDLKLIFKITLVSKITVMNNQQKIKKIKKLKKKSKVNHQSPKKTNLLHKIL